MDVNVFECLFLISGHSSQGRPQSSQGRPQSSQGRPASAAGIDLKPKEPLEPHLTGQFACLNGCLG